MFTNTTAFSGFAVDDLQPLGGDRVLEMLDLRRPDDRRRHARLVQQPRERDLRARDPALSCNSAAVCE